MQHVEAADGRCLPRTRAALQAGVDRGLHRAAHVHVAQGDRQWSCGVGATRNGRAVDADTIFAWTCATKPILAMGLGVLCDRGDLDLWAPVTTWLPEAPSAWAAITPVHLLTHTVGWEGEPGARAAHQTWDEALHDLLAGAPLQPGWDHGRRAAYSVWTSWLILGEIAGRLAGRPAGEWLEDTVLAAAGTAGASITLSGEAYDELEPRLAHLHHVGPEDTPYLLDQRPWCSRGWPGLGGRGTTADLAAVFRLLLDECTGAGPGLLRPETARALVTPWRVGLLDEATGTDFSWGLGITVDRRAVHPKASEDTFSHAGLASSTLVFADPRLGLVVAISTDGIPGGLGAMARRFGVTQAVLRDVLPLLEDA